MIKAGTFLKIQFDKIDVDDIVVYPGNDHINDKQQPHISPGVTLPVFARIEKSHAFFSCVLVLSGPWTYNHLVAENSFFKKQEVKKLNKKRIMAMILSMVLAMGLCACGKGAAPTSDTDSSAGTEATEKTTAMAETTETAEAGSTDQEKTAVTLPEDKGMAGVYKWVEMANYGVDAYLLLWDDGTGLIDMVGTGTVTDVSYDDKTMQSHDEGAVLQSYTYADDKLTWSYTDNDGEHVSTFVRLTAQERAAYEALGVGSVADKDGKN